MERQIALAAGSMRLHYPEARIVLLTNPAGKAAELPEWIERDSRVVDFTRIMFERTISYRNYVSSAA